MSRAGLSVPRTRRSVATRSASPSSAKYSQVSGISTASAATSALSVSSPSDGGVSMKMTSKSPRSGRAGTAAAVRDWGAMTSSTSAPVRLAIGGNERETLDLRGDDGGATSGDVGREGVVDGGRCLALEADAAGEVGLRVEIDQEHALFGHGECRGQVDGGRGFADATLSDW